MKRFLGKNNSSGRSPESGRRKGADRPTGCAKERARPGGQGAPVLPLPQPWEPETTSDNPAHLEGREKKREHCDLLAASKQGPSSHRDAQHWITQSGAVPGRLAQHLFRTHVLRGGGRKLPDHHTIFRGSGAECAGGNSDSERTTPLLGPKPAP